jgi:uncharacterized protein
VAQQPTVLVVPGLRDHVQDHWQTLLVARLPRVRAVAPLGRENLDLAARIAAIEHEARAIDGPIVINAHSAGTIAVAHWARTTRVPVVGALLAVPPDLERPMPAGYPSIEQLRDAGWLPVPRTPLPFHSIVAASRNDPLAAYGRVLELAADWGSTFVDVGEVGHLNPASGHGPWPRAESLMADLVARPRAA